MSLADAGQYGMLVNIDGPQTVGIPLSAVVGKLRRVPVDGEVVCLARELGVSFGE